MTGPGAGRATRRREADGERPAFDAVLRFERDDGGMVIPASRACINVP